MKLQLGFGSFVLLLVLVLLFLASVWYAAQGFLLPGIPCRRKVMPRCSWASSYPLLSARA
jgi:hypothetical protein